MKTFLLFLSLVLFSGCDMLTLKAPPEKKANSYTPASDADFELLSGERFEKYYLIIDPAIYDKKIGFQGAGSRNNRFSLEVTYRHFYDESSSAVLIPLTGAITFQRRGSSERDLDTRTFSASLASFSTYFFPLNIETKYEPYSLSKSFSSSSLALPKSDEYSNPYRVYKYKTYTLTIPRNVFRSLFTSSESYDDFEDNVGDIYEWFDSNVTATPEIFEPFTLESRNFYQYKNFTLKYKKDVKVMGFNHNDDVVDHFDWNPDENAVTVYFKEYDEPYLGEVISYWIQAEDGSLLEKKVTVEDIEQVP